MDGLDRAFEVVIQIGALNARPADYLGAVRQALASEVQLSTLLPQDHSESTIRGYLVAVERRLARELGDLKGDNEPRP
jgi:hypothetical protein